MFPVGYENTFIEWNKLRSEVRALNFDDALHAIHDWWNRAPMSNPTLHFDFYEEWPLPWDLLADNNYCEVAKCLAIVYTIIIIERPENYSMYLLQTDNYTYVEIKTTDKTYVLNDQPGSITADLSEERILHKLDCSYFASKL